MPKVSVIIPTYNRSRYICEAIDSVLAQTYKDFEIIIVDDGSTDNTKGILSKYNSKIRYFYKTNGGVASARNFGINKATGEYIAFIDSDDLWLETKLKKQVDYMGKNNTDLVYCNMCIMENGIINYKKIKPTKPAFSFFDLLLDGGNLTTSTILLKKTCFDRLGLFNESFKVASDYEMWLRFSLVYNFGFINLTLATYRQHSDNLSIDLNGVKFKQTGIRIYKELLMNHGVNRSWVRRRLSLEYYLLAKGYYDENGYKKAIIELKNCLFVNPLVGLSLINKNSGIVEKSLGMIKPYVFLIYLALLILKGNK